MLKLKKIALRETLARLMGLMIETEQQESDWLAALLCFKEFKQTWADIFRSHSRLVVNDFLIKIKPEAMSKSAHFFKLLGETT